MAQSGTTTMAPATSGVSQWARFPDGSCVNLGSGLKVALNGTALEMSQSGTVLSSFTFADDLAARDGLAAMVNQMAPLEVGATALAALYAAALPAPTLTGITPATMTVGATLDAVISGTSLTREGTVTVGPATAVVTWTNVETLSIHVDQNTLLVAGTYDVVWVSGVDGQTATLTAAVTVTAA